MPWSLSPLMATSSKTPPSPRTVASAPLCSNITLGDLLPPTHEVSSPIALSSPSSSTTPWPSPTLPLLLHGLLLTPISKSGEEI
ncbi:hypothetical protein OPV22_002327 [Ensete ventricosum]|uniref:Uncharacterized protein n=1 Tax=Ensete ventricosum TaxID=4639 RepID=A0AAV8RXI5_ENSVE|nr:hypothetical protein OPV22_002327 [Ensete ventricosum]